MTGKILTQIGILPRNGGIAGRVDDNRITPSCRLSSRTGQTSYQKTFSIANAIDSVQDGARQVVLRVGKLGVVADRHRFARASQ